MSLELKVAITEDVELLLPLGRAYHELEGVRLDAQAREMAVKPLLGESDLGRIWIVHAEGVVVGYVALCFGYSIEFAGRDAFVDEFFIAEPHRGRGIGRRVLGLVIEEARKLGARALHLEVARANQRAQRLYASPGFVPRNSFHLMSRSLQGGLPAAADMDPGGDA